MSVRAKFKVDSITLTTMGAAIDLSPVINGSKENAEFYKYTPAGSLKLSIVSPGAAAQFVAGAEYYIDITPA